MIIAAYAGCGKTTFANTHSDICVEIYSRRYYKDENTFVISGHTPTPFIRADRKPEILLENGHIAIDCGCVYGGRLAAYCIETGSATYVNRC